MNKPGDRDLHRWQPEPERVWFAGCPRCDWRKLADEQLEAERAAQVHLLACRWRGRAVACRMAA